MDIATLYGISNEYYSFLMRIWDNNVSIAGGQALLYFYLSLCIISLIFYTIIFYLAEKNLKKVGILTPYKLKKIYKLSPTHQLNGFYSLGIFWVGIMPLAVEILGEGKFSLPNIELLTLTLIISIPFTYINLRGLFVKPIV